MADRTTAGWAGAVVGAAGVGLAVSAYLTWLHLHLFYGGEVGGALCDVSAALNCSAVNSHPASELWGVPQSVLAVPAYVVAAGLGLLGHRRGDVRYALALTGLGGLTVGYSAWLAWLSATQIGAWCLFCMVLYAVNLALLGLGVRGAGLGAGGSLAGAAGLPLRAPALVGGAVLAGGLALGAAWLPYDHVRDGMAAKAAAAAVASAPAPAAAKTAATAPAGGETKKVRLGAAKQAITPPKGAPRRGPEDARVTIVELSDFQCPFCKRLAGILHQLQDEYPKDVALVYVQFPLNLDCNSAPLKKSMHPDACRASAASVCADQQGKFWEMHDRLFDLSADLRPKGLSAMARDLGLDLDRFEACLSDPKTEEAVRADTAVGADLGVLGTPTFFVNGRQMAGAQPIEVLRAVVEAELAGNTAALDLDVAVGTEITGPVTATATAAPIAASPGVTIDAFEASLDGARAVSQPGVAPARGLSWYDAKAACEAAGKRLCTEREWLAACTGQAPNDADGNGVASDDPILGRAYGYGERRKDGACADSRNPAAVGELLTGNHPQCGTPDGLYDLVGNLKEWVGLSPATAALKGGSYSSGESARCGYFRDDIAADTKDDATGFRCCAGPPDPPAPPVVSGRDIGEALAPFEVAGLDGKTIRSKALAGKPTVLTFWASWCGPCQKEMPALASLYTTYKDKGLQVLAVSVDSQPAKLTAWLDKHPMPFLIGTDPTAALMNSFPNRGLPTTLWIKADGTIRLRTTGVPPGGEERLEALVLELLGGG